MERRRLTYGSGAISPTSGEKRGRRGELQRSPRGTHSHSFDQTTDAPNLKNGDLSCLNTNGNAATSFHVTHGILALVESSSASL